MSTGVGTGYELRPIGVHTPRHVRLGRWVRKWRLPIVGVAVVTLLPFAVAMLVSLVS